MMHSVLNGECASTWIRRIYPPFLEHVVRDQMQIDCEGLQFQGGSGHAEFVFRDDALAMVWITTSAEKQTALERVMTKTYGLPKNRGGKYLQYAKARAALGLDKHELLFYSLELAAEIEAWFVDADAHRT
jgi:hypothetical protein